MGRILLGYKTLKLLFMYGILERLLCVGSCEEMMARDVFHIRTRIMREAGFKAKVCKFKVHNFVSCWNMGSKIKLDDFAESD